MYALIIIILANKSNVQYSRPSSVCFKTAKHKNGVQTATCVKKMFLVLDLGLSRVKQ